MQTLQKKGILVLDDRQKTRLELLTKIKDPNAVIVFSAHGTPQEALDYANTHFKQFYDLTCPYLQDHFILIKRLIKQGYRIIYYGKKQHPETHAVLSFSSHIYLIENVNDVNKIQ